MNQLTSTATTQNSKTKLFCITRSHSKANSRGKTPALAERLATLMHTSIDIEKQLELYFREIKKQLQIQKIDFFNPACDLNISYGDAGANICRYTMQTENDYLGEICFYREQRFSREELAELEDSLRHVAYPFRNALQFRNTKRMALTDPLTQAGNRIAFDNSLKQEMAQTLRSKKSLALLAIDLDKFKNINDRYGHSAGDLVLRQCVRLIRQSIRDVDNVFRLGGEEFMVILHDSSAANAKIAAERIRQSVEAMQSCYQGEEIKITLSIGISSYNGEGLARELIDSADRAMYEAKSNGRNRVIIAKEG